MPPTAPTSVIGLRLGDIGAGARGIVLHLIKHLLGGIVVACKVSDTAALLFRISRLRSRFGDLGCQRGDLFGTHAGIDVVVVGGRRGESRARLSYGRAELNRR